MVLCITHSGDFYTIDIVQQALQQAGVRSFRLNTDEFGTRYRFSYSLQGYTITCDDQQITASEIQAVWYRKMWELKVPEELDATWQPAFNSEYQTHRQIFLHALQNKPWINELFTGHQVCADKLQQLVAAQAAGLCVPRTIFTNDANTVRNFYSHCNGKVIMKLHNALSKSMKGDGPFFPTTRLTEEGLPYLESLVYCPMIFQEYIEKEYELRIVYIDGIFFTGKINPAYNQVTDWRTVATGTEFWLPYKLPLQERNRISALMHRLGLSYGAIDVIKNSNGEYYFLEVNPFGEWGMLQKVLGYPIGETISEKLIMRINHEQ